MRKQEIATKMPRCTAINITTLDPCANNARPGEEMCRRHSRTHQLYTERHGAYVPGFCQVVSGTGRCGNPNEPEQALCMHHRHLRERRHLRQLALHQEHVLIQETYHQYVDNDPLPPWQEVMIDVITRSGLPLGFPGYLTTAVALAVARRYFTNPFANPDHFLNERFFLRTWRWVRMGGINHGTDPPAADDPIHVPPPPIQRLHALAQDAQNVHTREVSDQTNESTRRLMEVVVPLTQKTEQTMMLAWYALRDPPTHHKIVRTVVDINKWFNTDTCRQDGDKLYKHVLRGLVAYIQRVHDPELKQELWMRSWEECSESVGLCCEGHISRLCNVLVGFDDAFKPPLPFSEILQSKMAAISGMDVSTDEKIQQATTFFNEYAVPLEQRQAWLDAFSEE